MCGRSGDEDYATGTRTRIVEERMAQTASFNSTGLLPAHGLGAPERR